MVIAGAAEFAAEFERRESGVTAAPMVGVPTPEPGVGDAAAGTDATGAATSGAAGRGGGENIKGVTTSTMPVNSNARKNLFSI